MSPVSPINMVIRTLLLVSNLADVIQHVSYLDEVCSYDHCNTKQGPAWLCSHSPQLLHGLGEITLFLLGSDG